MNSAFPMPTQLDIATPEDMFMHFWRKGYPRLCGVIPPNAPLSPHSSLYKRMQKNPASDDRGKTPGALMEDGLWKGVDFTKIESTAPDLEKWQRWGCSVGVKTGRGLYMIDADTMDPKRAKFIADLIQREIGVVPTRIGQHPKVGYLVRMEDGFKYRRVEFGKWIESKGKNKTARLDERVEVLSDNKFFVAWGPHPKTGLPYSWPGGIPEYRDIPFTDEATIVRILEAIRDEMPNAEMTKPEGSAGDAPPQETLLGDPDVVRRVANSMTNLTRDYPSRESYLRVGYAIKAAMGPDREYEARELFEDWASRWDDEEGNDPDTVRSDWDRLVPPFRVGASWLYDSARKTGSYDVWMDGEEEGEPALFPPEPGTRDARIAAGEGAEPLIPIYSIADLKARKPKPFLIKRHIPQTGVGFLYGAPGCFKSFLALDMALARAFDFPSWQGDAIRATRPGCVIYLAGEGADGFKNRVAAWMKTRGVGEDRAGRFGLIDQSVDFMDPEAVGLLVRSMKIQTGCPVDMIVVDTVSRALPGADENLQKDMSLFVKACDRLRDAFGCVVIGVHHAGKSGDMRGSTVLRGAGDFVFKMVREQGSRIVSLTCEKQKEGADGWTEKYRVEDVDLGMLVSDEDGIEDEPQGSLTIGRMTSAEAAEAGGLTPANAAAILQAIREAGELDLPWSLYARSKERFYVRRMVADFGLSADVATATMDVWLGEGRVVERQKSGTSKSKAIYLAEAKNSEVHNPTEMPNVFE